MTEPAPKAGRALLAVGSVLLTLGLVLGGVALALDVVRGGAATGDETTPGDTTPAASASSLAGDDGGPETSTTTGTLTPGESTTGTTAPGGGPESTATSVPSGSTTSTMTPPTLSTDELAARLAAAAAAAGFPVLGSNDPQWELVSVDAGTSGAKPYVATSYERGSDYFSTSQEAVAGFPEVPNTKPVTVHGLQGDILDMGHVVVIRWVENGTAIIFNTSLGADEALAVAETLRPIR